MCWLERGKVSPQIRVNFLDGVVFSHLYLLSSSALVMPRHSCLLECNSNSKTAAGKTIAFHSFLCDRELVKKWIINIPRDVSEICSLNRHTKVCSLSFENSCYFNGDYQKLNRSATSQKQTRKSCWRMQFQRSLRGSRPKWKPQSERLAPSRSGVRAKRLVLVCELGPP